MCVTQVWCDVCARAALGVACTKNAASRSVIYKRRVGQNPISAPYMTVCMVISLLKLPYIHRIYMVLAKPMYKSLGFCGHKACAGLARTVCIHRV